MKFPDLVHAAKPEPHFAMPQAGVGARHVLGLRLADARDHPHADVGDVRSRHPAQLPDDAGVWRAHLPAGQRRRRVALRQVPLDARRPAPTRWCGTRRSRSPAPIPTSTAATCGRPSRPAPIRSTSWACRSSPRSRPRRSRFDVLDATKIVPEELVPVDAGGQAGAQPQPGQLLRRDRAGRLLRRARRTRHRLLERSAARRPHPLLRRHPDLAARRPELPRDPDQRADRAGAQQPARRHASAGDPPRARALRAELARRRVSVPGRARPGSCRSRSRARPATHKVRGKAERFADHYTQARLFWNSQTPSRAAAHHQRVPLRAVEGADAGRARAHGVGLAERRAGAGRGGRRRPRHARTAGADAEGARAGTSRRRSTDSPALSLFARPGQTGISRAPHRDPGCRRLSTARLAGAAERADGGRRRAAVRRPRLGAVDGGVR